MLYILYLLVGAAAGLFAGLLGLGGGIIVVPALIYIFKYKSLFPEAVIMQIAVGTSLATMIFTTTSSSLAYKRRNLIVWPLFWRFFPGICIGITIGTFISKNISSDTLIMAFAIFLILIAIYIFFSKKPSEETKSTHNLSLNLTIIGPASIIIGIIAATFGLSGGILMVPLFMFFGLNIRQASGTSAICGVPVAILGTVLLTVSNIKGLSSPDLLGFVYWPAALIIVCTSIFTAALGVRTAAHFKQSSLRKIFAIVLLITAIHMLY